MYPYMTHVYAGAETSIITKLACLRLEVSLCCSKFIRDDWRFKDSNVQGVPHFRDDPSGYP